MQETEKEKLCVDCEGRIPADAQRCPLCGTDQVSGADATGQMPLFQNQSLKESLASLYTPPYQGKREGPIASPPPSYQDVTDRPFRDVAAEELAKATSHHEDEVKQSAFWPTLLLVLGSNILVLSLMLLFLSHRGVLRLEWNANYWFLYFLSSLPLLYFGYKRWKLLD